jgi:hypothetical protein
MGMAYFFTFFSQICEQERHRELPIGLNSHFMAMVLIKSCQFKEPQPHCMTLACLFLAAAALDNKRPRGIRR